MQCLDVELYVSQRGLLPHGGRRGPCGKPTRMSIAARAEEEMLQKFRTE